MGVAAPALGQAMPDALREQTGDAHWADRARAFIAGRRGSKVFTPR